MGTLQALACGVMLIHFANPVWLLLSACVFSMGAAFMDVVVDGLMVINSRMDPTSGSEELQVWSWSSFGLGGTVGCLISGFFLSRTDPVTGVAIGNPYLCIFIQGCFSVLVALSGLIIDKRLEENQEGLRLMTFR
jgi:MFS family permease